MNAYNAQVHWTTGTSPFIFCRVNHLDGPMKFVTPMALPTNAKSEKPPKALRYRILSRLSKM